MGPSTTKGFMAPSWSAAVHVAASVVECNGRLKCRYVGWSQEAIGGTEEEPAPHVHKSVAMGSWLLLLYKTLALGLVAKNTSTHPHIVP